MESPRPGARAPKAAVPEAEGAVASTGLGLGRALLSEPPAIKQEQPGMVWPWSGALDCGGVAVMEAVPPWNRQSTGKKCILFGTLLARL